MSATVVCECGHVFDLQVQPRCPECGKLRSRTGAEGWELAEGSVLYWLLVAHRIAHSSHPLDRIEDTLRSAERDADHRLRRSSHPYDRKTIELLRPVSTRLMMDGNDQLRSRLARAEMKLAIYRLSEAFGDLRHIKCQRCFYFADQHCERDGNTTSIRDEMGEFITACDGHKEP